MNATYSGWRGSIMVALNQLLCWDQYFSVGGALRHVEFDPTPGTLNCADFPASVSTAPVQAMEISLYPAYNVLSKMIYARPGDAPGRDVHRRHEPMAGDHLPRHRPVGRALRLSAGRSDRRRDRRVLDAATASRPAASRARRSASCPTSSTPSRPFRCCSSTARRCRIPAAPGKWRGGLSAESCFIPHNTDKIVQDTLSSGNAIPTSTGMMGGYPGTHQPLHLHPQQRHPRAPRRARDGRGHRRGQGRGSHAAACARRISSSIPPTSMRWCGRRPAASAIRLERDAEHVLEDWQQRRGDPGRGARASTASSSTRRPAALDRKATKALRERHAQEARRRHQGQAAQARRPVACSVTENLAGAPRRRERASLLRQMRQRSRSDARQLQGPLPARGQPDPGIEPARRRSRTATSTTSRCSASSSAPAAAR